MENNLIPKYRYLTEEELKHFDDDFKHFLIVNHVYKEEWEKLTQSEPEKALKLVALFSNQVLQRVYEKINYLEKRAKDACFIFHFTKTHQDIIIIQAKSDDIDLSTPESIHENLKNNIQQLDFFKSTKNFNQTREQEIHILLEQGAVLSSKEFWDLLEKTI